jgi:CcmD family protein
MKFLMILFIGFLGLVSNTSAQIARLVHYQGMLQNSDGSPFTGTADLAFSIYQRPLSETPIWTEQHKHVEVKDGRYEVLLGSENPLNLSFYEYFLEVRADALGIKSSKIPIAGSGYNFRINFLFAAYTIVWLALFLYMLSVARRQKKIIAELETLAQARTRAEAHK